MRKFATFAAALALATAQAGPVMAAQATDPAATSAAYAPAQMGDDDHHDHRRKKAALVLVSLAALGAFTWGLIAALRHHHGDGGRPASP